LKQNPHDTVDPEGPADLAAIFSELGEASAADTWLAESVRRKPDNLLAAGSEVALLYARGDHAAALTKAFTVIPRQAEEHHDFWRSAIELGCLAADATGRIEKMRDVLVQANALPRDLSQGGFKDWVGNAASPLVKLREISGLRRCVFSANADDAPRRDQLRALFSPVVGADWESKEEWRGIAAELRNDRAAILAYYLPRDTAVSRLPLREGIARQLGLADDPNVARHFAEQREQIAQMRAALPAALAKEGLSMLPQNARTSRATP
jgi:hypothetical protein